MGYEIIETVVSAIAGPDSHASGIQALRAVEISSSHHEYIPYTHLRGIFPIDHNQALSVSRYDERQVEEVVVGQ